MVLAVGTRLQIPISAWGTDDKLKIIKIDIDPAEMERLRKPEIGLVGHSARVLRRLDRASRATLADAAGAAGGEPRAQGAQSPPRCRCWRRSSRYLRAIRDVLPDNGVLIDELTQVGYAARSAYEARAPRTYISSGYQGTLGWGVATAHRRQARARRRAGGGDHRRRRLHVQRAGARDARCATASRSWSIVFNDGAYGNVRNMQKSLHGNRLIGSDLANPDFIKLADSFGIGGHRVTDAGGAAPRARTEPRRRTSPR